MSKIFLMQENLIWTNLPNYLFFMTLSWLEESFRKVLSGLCIILMAVWQQRNEGLHTMGFLEFPIQINVKVKEVSGTRCI